MFRVGFGLTSLFLSLLFVARSIELLPDAAAADVARRQAVCEAVTIECALSAQRQAEFPEAFARAMSRRHSDVLSIGLRDTAGGLVGDLGGHEEHWAGAVGEHSTPTHMFAPVTRADGTPRGRLEIAFAPLPYSSWPWRLVGAGAFPVLAFVGLTGWLVSGLYLRTVFRKVDLAQAKLVPQRVRDTLNTLAEGV